MRQDERLLLQHLERVVGPMAPLNDRDDPRAADWWFRASYRGRDVRIGLSYATTADAITTSLDGVRFGVPLGERPIELSIMSSRSDRPGAHRVLTGDPDFDARFLVHALPAEAASFLLDARARRWFVDAFAPEPQVRAGSMFWGGRRMAGWLDHYRLLRSGPSGWLGRVPLLRSGISLWGPANVPPPEQLAGWLEATIELTDRVVAGFDAAQASIARERGPAAAEWLAQQIAAERARARRRARRRRAILAIAVAIVLAVAVASTWGLLRALLSL